MSILHRYVTKITTWCGLLRFTCECQDMNDTTSVIDVRRVKPESTDEHVQISISVQRHHRIRTGTRTVESSGYLELTPEQVPLLITALTKLHPPYDPAEGHKYWDKREARERAFYGLEEPAHV